MFETRTTKLNTPFDWFLPFMVIELVEKLDYFEAEVIK